jgi:hypothetical protein
MRRLPRAGAGAERIQLWQERPMVDVALLAEAVSKIPVVGGLLALIVRQKRWRLVWMIASVALLVIVYPLFVPVMAAWLINAGLLAGLTSPYAATVDRALKIEESTTAVVKKSNERLDYFQMIDLYETANSSKDYQITVAPYQRIRIRSFNSTLSSNDVKCPIPNTFNRPGAALYQITLGTVQVGSVRNDGDEATVEITKQQWDAMRSQMNGDELGVTLTPVDELQKITCDGLKASIRISVEVFKDLLQ